MIKTTPLKFAYNGKVSFDFPEISGSAQSPILIIGPSGCGKSTLLHLLGGLMKPHSGNIIIGDTELTSLSGQELDKFRGKHIGIIFQKPHFIRSLNVLDNLLVAPFFGGINPDVIQAKAILKELGLEDRMYEAPNTLSQGEQQRLSIARVLINKPDVILADEPTSALDDYNCEEVIRLLREKAESSNSALVVVTHDGRLKDQISNQIQLTSNND